MLGLAQLLLQSLVQKKIRDLGATYLTLSFAEIADKTGLNVDILEDTLTRMVQKKAMQARINKKQGTVDFIDSEDGAGNEGNLVNLATYDLIKQLEG